MAEMDNVTEKLVTDFTEHYMEKLFYFCLKKTGNSTDAEDLTQDIALNILAALNKGIAPTHFSAWVWQIARNRYSVWIDSKCKKSESMIDIDIGDYEIQDDSECMLEKIIREEQLSLLRRELAFIGREYRNVVVGYYIEGKSMRDIATSLSISEASVKQRLYRARNILKEGIYMAKKFGVRSYKPEQITFVMSGKDGRKGQPYSIISHLLYKNIFLEVYENPETAEELSLELGIALPYMEDELDFLVREQLLKREGNKYQTNFEIISKEEQRIEFEANKRVQKPLTDKICELIDVYIENDAAKVNMKYVGYEAAKWALLVRAFDYLSEEACGNKECAYPERPDEGAWILTGYETIDWKKPAFVGEHGDLSYDENEVKMNIDFAQFKFYYKYLYRHTPEHLTWREAYTLWLVCTGRMEETEKGYLEKLLAYGYLKKEDSKILPNIVIFDRNAEKPYNEELTNRLTSLRNEIEALLGQAPDIKRGYVVEQAIHDGWLKYDEQTIPSIGAYIYI